MDQINITARSIFDP